MKGGEAEASEQGIRVLAVISINLLKNQWREGREYEIANRIVARPKCGGGVTFCITYPRSRKTQIWRNTYHRHGG